MHYSTIESLLKDWGRFRREGWEPGLDYYKINNLLRVPGGEDEEIPEGVIEVDKRIAKLPRESQQALRLIYVKRKSFRKAAECMEMGRPRFTQILRNAEGRVEGQMAEYEMQKSA